MGSKDKESRLAQKAYLEHTLKKRLSTLADKGITAADAAKDAFLRKIRAELRDTEARLRAIDLMEKKAVEMAKAKAEKMAGPKKEKQKKKKAQEQEPDVSKRQQKKKKKKEGKTKP